MELHLCSSMCLHGVDRDSFNFTLFFYLLTSSVDKTVSRRCARCQKGKGKDKFHPTTCLESTEGEWRYRSTIFLTSALDGVCGHRHASAALPLGMTQYTVRRSGPQGRSGWVRNIFAPIRIRTPNRPARSESRPTSTVSHND